MATLYNLTANSSTDAQRVYGDITFDVSGTFGGGTLALEFSIDGSSGWYTPTDDHDVAIEYTSAGSRGMRHGGIYIRHTLTGATAPNIDIQVSGVSRQTKN